MDFRRFIKLFIPKKLFRKIEPYGHLVEAVLFNALNGFPARKLKVIGVTGTNGKTTTCFLIHKMLQEAGFKAGLMTTVAYGAGDDIKPQTYHMTNVTLPALMKRLKYMNSQGVEWLVLETTSQGLAQNRTWGVPYSLAVLTNVTHEHLDWHGSFENYRDAKKKLFTKVGRNKKGLNVGIVIAEDACAELFAKEVKTAISYGIDKGDLRATKLKMTPGGSRYRAVIEGDEYSIQCHLPGSFNVSNSLAAVAVGRALGLGKDQIEKGIAGLRQVAGRMMRLDEGQDFDVIVDYAHTPDSFEKLFKDLKPVVKGKLIVLFGSAGRRDETKRAVQGRLAGEFADEVIITEEDDRDVDGVEIMNQIASGAEKSGKVRDKDLFLVHNREEAINFAIKRAKADDTVLLLGKGHENTIERDDREDPWDEVGTAQKALRSVFSKTG